MQSPKKPQRGAEMFKDGYEGHRPSTTLSNPERQALRQGRAQLVQRIHDAVLTLSVLPAAGPSAIKTGSVPQHLVEFADRVGEEKVEAPAPQFEPTAAQVTDMPKALQLLEGLTKPFFTVVLLRALHVFEKEEGGKGRWPWKAIGAYFGLSESWAEAAYDAAIVQAARRSGLLPLVQTDYGILAVGVWVDRAWLTNLSTAADPRQAVSNLKGKSPVKLEQAYTIWVPGKPLAQRIVELAKPSLKGLQSHGSWFKVHPDVLEVLLIEKARETGSIWLIEDIPTKGALAA